MYHLETPMFFTGTASLLLASASFAVKMPHLKKGLLDSYSGIGTVCQLKELEMYGSLYPLLFLFLPVTHSQ